MMAMMTILMMTILMMTILMMTMKFHLDNNFSNEVDVSVQMLMTTQIGQYHYRKLQYIVYILYTPSTA